MPDNHKSQDVPSEWVQKHTPLIRQTTGPNSLVLDIACGAGRHTRFLLDAGFSVLALDKDVNGLEDIRSAHNLEIVQVDLETGNDEVLRSAVEGKKISGIVIINYLYRPLFSFLSDLLIEGGVLIYQTFMQGNEQYGRPRNPDFLLAEDELKEEFSTGFDVVAFEQGYVERPAPAMVQKICAVKKGGR